MATHLDRLQRAMELLKELVVMDDETLRAAVAAGFQDERPPGKDKELPPENWAVGYLRTMQWDCKLLADRFDSGPSTVIANLTVGEIELGPVETDTPERSGLEIPPA